MLKKLALAALGALIVFSAGAARAAISDFAVRGGVAMGDTVTAMDFTPDGRFIVVLHGTPGTVSFLDTWDMALLSGATAEVEVASGSTVALSLSVSPYSTLPFAYVGLSNGQVAVINYAKVAALGALEELTAALPVTRVEISTNPVEQVMAVKEYGGASSGVYLLAGVPAEKRVYWTRLNGGASPGAVPYFVDINREVVSLSRGARYGYILSADNSALGGGLHYLDAIKCSDLNRTCTIYWERSLAHDSGDVFSGLAVDRIKDVYSVTMNRTAGKEFLFTNFSTAPPPLLADTFTVDDAVAVATQRTPFDSTMADAALTAGGNTVTITGITSLGTAFGGEVVDLAAGFTVAALTASGGTEGLAFIGGPDGTVSALTAHPWITSYTVVQAGNTVNLTFSASSETTSSLRFAVFANADFRAWASNISGTLFSADTVTTAEMSVSSLQECANTLTLVVQDNLGRQGWGVASAIRDTTPSGPNFSLGFSSRRMVVDFTVSNLCDLARYEIYWGDTNTLPVTDYWLLEAHGGKVTIDGPDAGERIQKVISGLTNGQRYWAQLVVIDQTDHVGVGSRLSVVPQAVETVTDASGEKGGFNCLGSIGGGPAGDPRALFGLMLPLMIYAAARWSRREKR